MEPAAVAELVADVARGVVPELMAPSLLPLGHVPVTAEVWEEERHVRFVGDAIYAVHHGDRAHWAVVVRESAQLPPGSVRLVALDEICVMTPGGRRGG